MRIFERVVNMEPTPVQMQSLTTVQSVFVWAQLKSDPLQALLNILGVEVDDHPQVVAALSELDWNDAIAKWSALTQPATLAQKEKAVVASGAAVLQATDKRVDEQVVVAPTVPNVSLGSSISTLSQTSLRKL